MTAVSFANLTTNLSMIFTAVSLILILIYAPSGIERQSRIPRKYYPLLKLISFLLVASNLLIQADVLSVTFLIQALLLIKIRG
jgi:accessory gene regulator B